jgi:hypothetical protein
MQASTEVMHSWLNATNSGCTYPNWLPFGQRRFGGKRGILAPKKHFQKKHKILSGIRRSGSISININTLFLNGNKTMKFAYRIQFDSEEENQEHTLGFRVHSTADFLWRRQRELSTQHSRRICELPFLFLITILIAKF